LIDQYCKVFEANNLDLILSPVAIGERPPKINDVLNASEAKNPVFEYKMDYYTALPNCTGTPAITIPVKETNSSYEFPSSFKIQGFFGEDYHLLRIA
jgi:Asp-tRNA(Asn)/Glu-tRNA(Gln) amidotransferase A subunit family amidase